MDWVVVTQYKTSLDLTPCKIYTLEGSELYVLELTLGWLAWL